MVVDASVWVSAFLPADLHHEVSRGWIGGQLALGATLVVPTLVLPEVAGAIARRTRIATRGVRAARQVQQVAGLRIVSLDVDLGSEAARTAADLRLRGADAVYVVLARTLSLPLVTWDQEIHDRARGFIEVMRP